MGQSTVPINGAVLQWARRESGFSRQDLAEELGVGVDELTRWENAQSQPSRTQFKQLAEGLARPSALFFMPEPPKGGALKVSLRASSPSRAPRKLDPEERFHLRWAQSLQAAAASVSGREADIALPAYSLEQSPRDAGRDFRDRLGPSVEAQLGWSDAYDAFRTWRGLLESRGLLVLQLPMGDAGVRGFSLPSETVPLLAVNRSYIVEARIYSMLHEVGHLVTRTESVCRSLANPLGTSTEVERWAEKFAAAFLLPSQAIRRAVGEIVAEGGRVDVRATLALSRRFKVSARATALALVDEGLASPRLYGSVHAAVNRRDKGRKAMPRRPRQGGERKALARVHELGDRAGAILLSSDRPASLNERDIARLLRLNTAQVDELRQALSA